MLSSWLNKGVLIAKNELLEWLFRSSEELMILVGYGRPQGFPKIRNNTPHRN